MQLERGALYGVVCRGESEARRRVKPSLRTGVGQSCARVAALLAILGAAAWAQPTVAVMPLRAVGGVIQSEADVATNLLETGLVKSAAVRVVERSDISQVLAAQEYSYGGYMDENLALKVGGLLSAQQIVLGSLARVGSKYFVTARLIEVATARTLRADSVEADAVEAAASRAEQLGFRLVGVRVDESGRLPVAPRFYDLMVSTTPEGAVVSLDGVPRGTSPALIEKVALGSVLVTAKKGSLFGERLLEIDREGVQRVEIALNRRLGRLFVRAADRSAVVKLDGQELGFLRDGLFPDVAEGERALEVVGAGLYWRGTVAVPAEGTATVDAQLTPVGAIQYRLPEGAESIISGPGLQTTVVGEGWIEYAPVATYSVRTSKADYETEEATLAVRQARTTELAPVLRPTASLQARLDYENRQRRMQALRREREALAGRRAAEVTRSRRLRRSAAVAYSVGVGFLLGAGAALAAELAAPSSDYPWLTLSGGLAVAGVIGAAVGTMALLEQTDLREIDAQLSDLDTKLRDLAAERK